MSGLIIIDAASLLYETDRLIKRRFTLRLPMQLFPDVAYDSE